MTNEVNKMEEKNVKSLTFKVVESNMMIRYRIGPTSLEASKNSLFGGQDASSSLNKMDPIGNKRKTILKKMDGSLSSKQI